MQVFEEWPEGYSGGIRVHSPESQALQKQVGDMAERALGQVVGYRKQAFRHNVDKSFVYVEKTAPYEVLIKVSPETSPYKPIKREGLEVFADCTVILDHGHVFIERNGNRFFLFREHSGRLKKQLEDATRTTQSKPNSSPDVSHSAADYHSPESFMDELNSMKEKQHAQT